MNECEKFAKKYNDILYKLFAEADSDRLRLGQFDLSGSLMDRGTFIYFVKELINDNSYFEYIAHATFSDKVTVFVRYGIGTIFGKFNPYGWKCKEWLFRNQDVVDEFHLDTVFDDLKILAQKISEETKCPIV